MKIMQPDANRVLFLRVPLYARRVLHVHCGTGLLGGMLKTREGGVEVYGIEHDPAAVLKARSRLDAVLDEPLETTPLPFPARYFDCIVLSEPERCGDALGSVLTRLAALLAPRGMMLIPVTEQDGEPTLASPERIGAILAQAGLGMYALWPWAELATTTAARVIGADLSRRAVCQAHGPGYDPVAHAHELLDRGHAEWAYEVFCEIPEHYRRNPEVDRAIQLEKQLCLLAMDKPGGAHPQLRLFRGALLLFYDMVEQSPTLHQTYQCQAEFWHRIGDDGMAMRLLRSVNDAAPAACIDEQLTRYTMSSPKHEDVVPPWDGVWKPRILMLLAPERVHYGLDVLYDGLRRVLGDEHVIEYPWKPTLHGHTPDRFAYYPCLFNHAGTPVPLESLLRDLREGRFDVLLFADVDRSLEPGEIHRIANAAPELPVFVLDAEDDCVDHRPEVVKCMQTSAIQGYFKRELLACVEFGPRTFPFPFAYPDERVPDDISGPRPRALFWAGQRGYGLRRLYIERMEAVTGETFQDRYDQHEYVSALRASRMGLNLAGAGFDCVRYWELPANGCLLFSERLPLRIPHNFRDGETAVFFDDLREFEDKLRHYLDHTEDVATIARAGYEHLKRYHTGSARARQVLGYIQETLQNRA